MACRGLKIALYVVVAQQAGIAIYYNKVEFTVNKGDEQTDTDETDEEVAEELVFDDPAKQEVIFDNEGGAVVIDEGYQNEDISFKEGPMPKSEKSEPKKQEATGEIEMVVEEAKGDTETANAKTVADAVESNEPYDPKRDLEHYKYPTLDLLKKYDNDGKPYIDMAEQNANKNRIVDVLRTFGVEISSIKATVGPTITLYEITPASGVRISKIKNLEDDIALSLAALGIRIIAPIPGKGTVGIEVPNAKPATVSMESILNSKKFQESKMELPCASVIS